jgi:hypothetical protein
MYLYNLSKFRGKGYEIMRNGESRLYRCLIQVVVYHGVEVKGTKVQERHTRTDTALLGWALLSCSLRRTTSRDTPPRTFAILHFRLIKTFSFA